MYPLGGDVLGVTGFSRKNHMLLQKLQDCIIEFLDGLGFTEAMTFTGVDVVFMGNTVLAKGGDNLVRLVLGDDFIIFSLENGNGITDQIGEEDG